ncbi:MAG TPA: ABC transporter ATP-binding protein [Myxococcaceae bacterium]|nr:ABC transporter ATP-binding protein [Myxococcaceae bacterium]
MTGPDDALVIEHLFTGYDRADVLQDVSLRIEPRSITCLLGSNGSGKTTLIRSILGLTSPRSGRIAFRGTELTRLPTHRIVRLGIGCIPEGRRVFPRLTALENLLVAAHGERRPEIVARRLERVFATFPELASRRTQLAGTMSGGEQAMVSIGRGLMSEPRLLLVDEPSLGLSPRLVQETFAVLRQIHQAGVTIFLVEQNVHQTLDIATRGYVLANGRVVTSGTAAELRADPRMQAAYFGAGGTEARR